MASSPRSFPRSVTRRPRPSAPERRPLRPDRRHALPSEIREIHHYQADTILDCPEPPEVRA